MNKLKSTLLITLLLIFYCSLSNGYAQNNKPSTIGPENGSLVIVGGGGGGGMEDIIKKFIELAGGEEAEIVVIPTAGGQEEFDQNAGGAGMMRPFVKSVTVLHTNDNTIANTDSFTAPLQSANAVWFSGGRQWRLVDAYKNTRTEVLFHEILKKGGVIGGSSAGATIQGSFLARGDTKNNQIMNGDHQEGFGFIKNIAIDQHALARNRQFDMFEILKAHPELLGISIDERTAVIVEGNQLEVIGDSYVIIYDGTFWSREGWKLKTLPENDRVFYFLREGDKYDLIKRRIIE
jgi:cyanophycinase